MKPFPAHRLSRLALAAAVAATTAAPLLSLAPLPARAQDTAPAAGPAAEPGAAATATAAATARHEQEAARIAQLAEQAYIFGLPIVMNYAVLYSYAVDTQSPQFKAPFNQLKNIGRVFTHEDTAVVTPNSDTPYSFAALDLRAEPVVITVPPVERGRYYSVMLCDASTYNYGLIGSIATGGVPGAYLVVGPHWQGKTPRGIRKVFRSGSALSLAGIRTQLLSPADIGKVQAIQAGYQVQTLSAWQGKPAPKAAPAIDFPPANPQALQQHFFAWLDFALRFIPATPDEQAPRAALAQLGIGNGLFGTRFADIAARHPQALAAGMAAGDARVKAAVPAFGMKTNGWNLFMASGGDRARYHGDWLQRAAVAKAGIYAIDISEAQYALTRTLPDGEPLDGGKHRYTLTFAANELPPADAFWSVTMYDGKSQLLVDNPLKRYLVNSAMLPSMRRNADGSLTIRISKERPAPEWESNWLPAPDGPIYLAIRLYGPQPRTLRGEWQVPPLVKETP